MTITIQAPPIEGTEQAYCRGCASPTFKFDPAVVYQPHYMYCDNCFGTRTKYGYEDEETEGCGECDACYEGERCENADDYEDSGARGNTNQHNPILTNHDFARLMQHRHPGVEYKPLPVGPGMVTRPVVDTAHEFELEEDEVRRGILEHTCTCGSTRFRMTARDTITVYYEYIDIADIPDESADYEIEASVDGEDYDRSERDYNESDESFECVDCSRSYQGEWCS